MRQAITTKYLSPTNFRGARVKATSSAGSITLDWAHEYNAEKNHWKAAIYLQEKMGWGEKNTLYGGSLPDGKGYVFVQVPRKAVA